MNPILTVDKLTTRLRIGGSQVAVVDQLSFDLHLGKTLALVGESGCGKTMAALSILRILPEVIALKPEGQVIYKGQNLLDLSERQMRAIRGASIGMIFQDPSTALNPVYTVGNQLIEVAEMHLDLYGEEAEERAINALQEVGIKDPQDRISDYPHQMSGGMRQRVMIAMALMCEPDILIADEPTTALDVTIQAQVLELMRELQRKKGMALLLITHDMGVVAEMADDVIVMYAAQDVERGDVRTIFKEMSHPYTRGLFESRPSVFQPQSVLKVIKGSVPPPARFPSGCRFHPRCPYMMEKCKTTLVPNFTLSENHVAKCLLYDGTEESEKRVRDA